MHSFGLFASLVGDREPVADVDAFDYEHVILGLDLAGRLDVVAVRIDFDLARLQRAGEGAGQSAAGGGDYVVEGGRVRRIAVGIDVVVLGNLRVNSKSDRLGLSGKVREPLRAAEPLDPHPGDVADFAHRGELYRRSVVTGPMGPVTYLACFT